MQSSNEERRLVKETLTRLRKCDNVDPEYEIVEGWAESGRTELLLELAGALRRYASHRNARNWQFGALFDHIGWVLPLSIGFAQVEASFRFALLAKPDSPTVPRMIMSRLASAQPQEHLEPMFERHIDNNDYTELLACLLHEMVIRDIPCRDMPGATNLAEKLLRENHPLSWLPLMKTDIEKEINLPVYQNRSHGAAMPFGPYGAPQDVVIKTGHIPEIHETTTQNYEGLISSCASSWQTESNGILEARTYEVSEAITPEDLSPAFVERLELDSTECRGAKLQPISASNAFTILFSAASEGGAYGGGHYGAYGRLYAWRSLTGLTGSPMETDWSHVYDRAQKSSWFRFDADSVDGGSSWFHQIAWDFGLIVIRPDGRSLAVLAATDED